MQVRIGVFIAEQLDLGLNYLPLYCRGSAPGSSLIGAIGLLVYI